MGISFNLQGYNTISSNILASTGVSLTAATHMYRFIVSSADKGYRLIGAAINVDIEKLVGTTWTKVSTISTTSDTTGVVTVQYTHTGVATTYRIIVKSHLTTNADVVTILDSVLTNPSDDTLANYRLLTPTINHWKFPAVGNMNEVYLDDYLQLVYKMVPFYDTYTKTYWYDSYMAISYTYNVSGTIHPIPFVESSEFIIQTQAQFNSGGNSGFAAPYNTEYQDGERTVNKWNTDSTGTMWITYQKDTGMAADPGPMYLTIPKLPVYIPRIDDYVKYIPSTLTLPSNTASVLTGNTYTLPTTATVTYSDGTVETGKTIIWDKTVDTSMSGIYTYTANYVEDDVILSATFTLTVLAKPTSLILSPSSITIFQNATTTLPTTGTVMYADGMSKTATLTWDSTVIKTSTVKALTYTASYTENGITVSAIYTINVIAYLVSIDMTTSIISIPQFSIYTMPTKAMAHYSTGMIDWVTVTWESVLTDTNTPDTYTFRYNYTKNGITVSNIFTITVFRVPSVLILNSKTGNVFQYHTYTPDNSATLIYTDGTSKTVNVSWVTAFNTNNIGSAVYTVSYSESGYTVYDTFALTTRLYPSSLAADPSSYNINQHGTFTPPTTGIVTYSDNSTIGTVPIICDTSSLNADVIGAYNIPATYTENGFTVSCIIVVNVIHIVKSLSLNVKSVVIEKGIPFTRDSNAILEYTDGTTKAVTVEWYNPIVDISTLGIFIYKCSYTESGLTVYDSLSIDVITKDHIVSLKISTDYRCIVPGMHVALPMTGIVTYLKGSSKIVGVYYDSYDVYNITLGQHTYTARYTENGYTVATNYILEVVNKEMKPLTDPYSDITNNGSYSDPYIHIKEREFSYELFEKITHGEYIEAMLDVSKYDVYKPAFKKTRLVDKYLLDVCGIYPEDYIITFVKKHAYMHKESLVLFINDIALDVIDPEYTINIDNDFVYIYSKKIQAMDITSVKVVQATLNGVMNKAKHTMPDYTIYNDNYLRFVLTSNGIHDIGTLETGIQITINVNHIKLDPYQSSIDFTKIFSKDVFALHGNNLQVVDGAFKVNKFAVINKTDNVLYIPYIDDIYDRTYYEKFFEEFANDIDLSISPVKNMDIHIRNMKLYLDHMNSYYKTYLADIYKYDIGVYEKLLLEDKNKPFYTFANTFNKADGKIVLTDDVLGKYKLNKRHFMISVYDYKNESKFELYIDNEFVHRNVTTVHYGGKKYIYISPQTITDNIRQYIIDKGYDTATGLYFMSDDDIWDKYIELIRDKIEIFVKRRRIDYCVTHTGFSYINRNIVELPVVNNYDNMSIFANGRRLYKDDYYLENIGDIRVAIIKRKFTEEIVKVSITHYKTDIPFIIYEFNKSDLINAKIPAEGDDIFVDGSIVTPTLSYTPDTSRMLIGLESTNTDYKISVIAYSNVKYGMETASDYRKDIIDINNMIPVIKQHYPNKKTINGLTRFHNMTDLEEYIFYLKYMVCGEIENVDVMGVMEGIPNITDELIDTFKAKYKHIFLTKNELNFDGGVEKDYPMDIQLGEILTDLDTRAIDYRYSLDCISSNIKGNYVKATTDETAVYNMNYIGEQIKK